MELSKERAENVAAALEAAGISPDRITVDYKGSTVNPYDTPEKNRVAVCVVDEECGLRGGRGVTAALLRPFGLS